MDRQYILDEIQRTANVNGGVPLGMSRFERETGIRRYDWFGIYWTKWGDAHQEAGYPPNRLQGHKLDDQELIDKLVDAIGTLGHFPTTGELRLVRRSDPTFPSSNVFDRLGHSRQAKMDRVREFCQSVPELAHLVSLCTAVDQSASTSKTATGAKDETAVGFVYLMKSGRNYKIGRTNAPGRREYELAIQMPEKGQTLHSIRTDDPVGIEAYWHQRFAAKGKNGEWFDLDPADIHAFKRRTFM